MAAADERTVGLRELRHKTGEVLARVRHGETIDVTERGRLIARLVPAEEPVLSPALQAMITTGRVRPATRPGHRPRLHAGDGTDRLGDALAAQRDEGW